MSDFLSINHAPDTVTLRGKKIDVPGISMEGIGYLITTYPDLMTRLTERFNRDGQITVKAVMEVAGKAVGAIIAAGFGHPGNEQAEQIAGQYSATEQLAALQKIADKTIPDGVGPFVEQWGELVTHLAKTPQPRKLRFKVLPRESKASSESVATPQAMSG